MLLFSRRPASQYVGYTVIVKKILFVLLTMSFFFALALFLAYEVYRTPQEVPAPIVATQSTSLGILPLKNSYCYSTDDEHVYYGGREDCSARRVIVSQADPKSFVVLDEHINGTYAKDASSFYVNTERFSVADPATFEPTDYRRANGYPHFFKDSAHLYNLVSDSNTGRYTLSIVSGADPGTFEVFETKLPLDTHSLFAKDKNQFYCFGMPSTNVDVATAHVVHVPPSAGNEFGDEYVEDKYGHYRGFNDSRLGEPPVGCVLQ